MSAIARALKLVESIWGKSYTHQGLKVFEVYKGKKIIHTMVLQDDCTIRSCNGKSGLIYPDGLKRSSTEWSKEPVRWYLETDRRLGKLIAAEVGKLFL